MTCHFCGHARADHDPDDEWLCYADECNCIGFIPDVPVPAPVEVPGENAWVRHFRLTPKGWAAVSRPERWLFTAPCKCGAVVKVMRSGVCENGLRHVCRVAA